MFVLLQIIISIALLLVSNLIKEIVNTYILGVLILFYFGSTLIPWLALNVRCLNGLRKIGAYIFINFIPIIERIWHIILVASNGDYGPNQQDLDSKLEYFEDEINQIRKQQDS